MAGASARVMWLVTAILNSSIVTYVDEKVIQHSIAATIIKENEVNTANQNRIATEMIARKQFTVMKASLKVTRIINMIKISKMNVNMEKTRKKVQRFWLWRKLSTSIMNLQVNAL